MTATTYTPIPDDVRDAILDIAEDIIRSAAGTRSAIHALTSQRDVSAVTQMACATLRAYQLDPEQVEQAADDVYSALYAAKNAADNEHLAGCPIDLGPTTEFCCEQRSVGLLDDAASRMFVVVADVLRQPVDVLLFAVTLDGRAA